MNSKAVKRENRYANLIPMQEIQSVEQQLYPFDIYNSLRQEASIRYDKSRNCWDVFDYETVKYILKNPSLFSSKRAMEERQESILMMDPPKHTKLRNLVNKAFTPRAIQHLEGHIEEIADYLLNEVSSKKQFDVVEDFAGPLPIIVIAELLGVPIQDRALFKKYSDDLVSGAENNSDEAFAKMMQKRNEGVIFLQGYFQEIIAERQQNKQEDLISLLLEAEIDGEKLTEGEVLGFCILLLVAGNETTTNLITNGVRYMTEDVDVQNKVRQDIPLVPNLVEETLRYYPPIQAIGRIAAEDVELGECKIKKGQQVISWAASANRDSAKFERPDTFVVHRKTNPHVSFGFGIHFCLGAPLARMEGKIAFAKLLEKGEFSKVQNQSLKPIDSPFVFGVKKYEITFNNV
ncbi:cytochrome P450 [Priestia megaterium]|uniref:cytochrome P450 n=1 Tax=Priestia megaterium TaxID=1404 RepID=UPI000BFA9C4B|nr:cytochrome P450 [Priestia megaterium]PFR97475.1 cytochrome P450 [Priestia megaterium]